MNREEWQLHLVLAERCVVEGQAQIEKQRTIIEELERNGWDTTRAKDFLAALFESQGSYERHRDRLQQEIGVEKAPSSGLPAEETWMRDLSEALQSTTREEKPPQTPEEHAESLAETKA